MAGHGHGGNAGGHESAAPVAPVVASTTTIISDQTREEIKKGHWGHFFKLIAIDLGVFGAVVGMNALYGRLKEAKEHKETIDEARKHAQEGHYEQAFHTLKRLPFGVGLNDEEILDESFVEAGRSAGATEQDLRGLELFLAGDPDCRKAFRDSVTRQEDLKARAALIAAYSKMTNTQRRTRLTAVGKLDHNPAEEIPQAVGQALVDVTAHINTHLKKYLERDRETWFNRMARFFIR